MRMSGLSNAIRIVGVGLALSGIGSARPTAQAVGSPPQAPLDRSLLDRYCVTCHNERLKTAGLMLDKVDVDQVSENAEVFEKVARKLKSGQMPPPGRPRPEPAIVDEFAASLENALDRLAASAPNPGRVPVHRLNRAEYVNVIHDLLALDVDGAALLPADSSAFGFDNNAEALSVTPALMNRYMSAATKISRLAVGDPAIRPATHVHRAPQFGRQDSRMGEDLPFGTHGGLSVRHAFPLDGEYTIRLRLQRNVYNTIRGLDREHEIEVRMDRALVKTFTIGGNHPGTDRALIFSISEDDTEGQNLHTYRLTADDGMELRLPIKAGTRLVTAAFTDSAPFPSEALPERPVSMRNAFSGDVGAPGIDTIEISGPYNSKAPETTPSRQRIFACHPNTGADEDPCASKILGALARRAYRRPVTDADLDGLLKLYRAGRRDGNFERGIQRALEALLASPAFLFRMERDLVDAEPGQVHRLTDLELASRLSFFLWKSIPDEELLDVAARGRLTDPVVLDQQVGRMLADPKATRWMTDFAGQWLLVRNLQALEPNPSIFPEFDDTLRDAMAKETELFFESQVREDRPLQELLRADYTFVNERLATHYGMPGVYGSHFRRVAVTNPARQGLLGQASILTVTSYAHRTSVVVRGKWVLETLLGAPPPPPPPDVPALQENDGKSKPTSLRERMEQHRANPVCASCHTRMDPMGFALEHFDGTGKWRDADSGIPIDATITLPEGTTIDSPRAFRDLLLRGDEFLTTVTEKLVTYALGRGVEYYDGPTVRQIVREMAQDDYRWSALVLGIVNSKPFQMRRVSGSPVSPAPPPRAAQRQ